MTAELIQAEPMVRLTMTRSDAEWLKVLVQNGPSDEVPEEVAIRKKFWHALHEAGIRL